MKRYNTYGDYLLKEENNGYWVKYENAEKLEKENKRLKDENAHYKQFIVNGVEYGFINLPEKSDPAYKMYEMVRGLNDSRKT